MIIGTFNHGWPWNDADFFYGRGMYMWTIMANLFLSSANVRTSRRDPVPPNNNPTLADIFEICQKGKLCFADAVLGTRVGVPTVVNAATQSILVNGMYQWTDYKDEHLNSMGAAGLLDDNVQGITAFIRRTPSIQHIYFSFATGGAWLIGLKNAIAASFPAINSGSIFTPTGNGFGNNLPEPFNQRAWSIAHHWVWNNMGHATVPVMNPNYTHLDHSWLIRNGVNPNNF
ncbi:MAG: hypothetical protein IPN61_01190 [Bacteroidetes bacterium]|nr:hypothetical protein [Bacteroidota bacterium]